MEVFGYIIGLSLPEIISLRENLGGELILSTQSQAKEIEYNC